MRRLVAIAAVVGLLAGGCSGKGQGSGSVACKEINVQASRAPEGIKIEQPGVRLNGGVSLVLDYAYGERHGGWLDIVLFNGTDEPISVVDFGGDPDVYLRAWTGALLSWAPAGTRWSEQQVAAKLGPRDGYFRLPAQSIARRKPLKLTELLSEHIERLGKIRETRTVVGVQIGVVRDQEPHGLIVMEHELAWWLSGDLTPTSM